MARPPRGTRRAVTATDVARVAGVSQSAVSRAFTPGARVAAATQQRILEVARQLGYRPNALARSLITERSRLVGVAVSQFTNLYHADFLDILCRGLRGMGYHAILFTTDLRDRPADPALEEIMQYRLDGLLLASTTISERLAEQCRAEGLPVVLVNHASDTGKLSSVTADNLKGGGLIAAFLAAGGHRRFGFLAGPDSSTTSRDRERGYAGWLAQQGLGAPLRANGQYSFPEAWSAARALLAAAAPPDAIFCADDHMAIAAIEVARQEFGLTVGRDVSIVGFEDVQPGRWPSYDLTSYSFDLGQLVGETLAILGALLERPDLPTRQAIIPGHLVVRSSARLPDSGVVAAFDRRIWRGPA